jgi:hypothetical protein
MKALTGHQKIEYDTEALQHVHKVLYRLGKTYLLLDLQACAATAKN